MPASPMAGRPYAAPPLPNRPQPTTKGGRKLYIWLSVGLGTLLLLTSVTGVYYYTAIQSSQQTQAAMQQLYQQVTSQTPTLVDHLNLSYPRHWAGHNSSTGLASCTAGVDGFHVAIGDPNKYYYCLNDKSYSNFASQVTMTILTGDTGGFSFRTNRSTQGSYIFFIRSNGIYSCYLAYGNTNTNHTKRNTLLASGAMTGFKGGVNQANVLTLIAQGHKFYFYANGQFASSITDATYDYGGIGLLASDVTQPTEVAYSEAKIWQI